MYLENSWIQIRSEKTAGSAKNDCGTTSLLCCWLFSSPWPWPMMTFDLLIRRSTRAARASWPRWRGWADQPRRNINIPATGRQRERGFLIRYCTSQKGGGAGGGMQIMVGSWIHINAGVETGLYSLCEPTPRQHRIIAGTTTSSIVKA